MGVSSGPSTAPRSPEETCTTPSRESVNPVFRGSAARASPSASAFDWRQYVIYIGFVVVFVFFAITLADRAS